MNTWQRFHCNKKNFRFDLNNSLVTNINNFSKKHSIYSVHPDARCNTRKKVEQKGKKSGSCKLILLSSYPSFTFFSSSAQIFLGKHRASSFEHRVSRFMYQSLGATTIFYKYNIYLFYNDLFQRVKLQSQKLTIYFFLLYFGWWLFTIFIYMTIHRRT